MCKTSREKRNEMFNLETTIQAPSTKLSSSSTSQRWVSVIQSAVIQMKKIPHFNDWREFIGFISFIFRNNTKFAFIAQGGEMLFNRIDAKKAMEVAESRPHPLFEKCEARHFPHRHTVSNNESRSTSDEWQMKCERKNLCGERERGANQITQQFPLEEIYVCHPSTHRRNHFRELL